MMLQYFCVILGMLTTLIQCEIPLDSYDHLPSTGNYSIDRFHIDKETATCRNHVFKGVGANFNSFPSLESCKKHLSFTAREQLAACTQPKDAGKCAGSFIKWHYDQGTKKCSSFNYTGCGGNGNVFDTPEDCSGACLPTGIPNVFDCKIIPEINEQNITTSFVADLKENRCISASVGGSTIRGIFESVNTCVNTCIPKESRLKACSTPAYQSENCGKQNSEAVLRYYYNREADQCTNFYSCEKTFSNEKNNFPSLLHCQSYCGGEDLESSRKSEDICMLQKNEGTGSLALSRYYYDGTACTLFTYGGIGGNGNNFEHKILCENICKS